MSAGLERLNQLPAAEAEDELLKCCGSKNWARGMAQSRPFRDAGAIADAADRIWRQLGREDWLAAFRCHPKIGEKPAQGGSAETRRWAEQEQSGARSAKDDVRAALAEGNRAYEAHFGYIYIVCATGRTSEEMLALLGQRLQNDPDAELRIAAEEQRKITQLRLEKLLRELEARVER